MLAELSIKNFAIIDDVSISFSDGFSVITGETGAGKSILVNALSLLLGARATGRMVRSGAEFAELSAQFFVDEKSELYGRLSEEEHDISEGLVVRRIIAANDRHRASINGRPVTSAMLSAVTSSLAGISGQHAHQGLLKAEQHLGYLDRAAGLTDAREKTAALYRQCLEALRALDGLFGLQKKDATERELFAFQKDEIERAAFSSGEDEELAIERNRLVNARFLLEAVSAAESLLYDADQSAAERLSEARKQLEAASARDPELTDIAGSVSEALFKVEDAARDLARYRDGLRLDDERLALVEERLYQLSRLKKKYGKTLADVSAYAEEISEKLKSLENLSEEIEKAEKRIDGLKAELDRAADALSLGRKKASENFSKRVAAELKSLGMPKARFEAALTPVPASPEGGVLSGIEATGRERAAFLIAPNPGESVAPLKDIASGGELSRVVLSLKAILARADAVETVVFDEVDAGIGGAVADSVGEKLRELSNTHQVIVITHLAQIARLASHHFYIEKGEEKGRTKSRIRLLSKEERVLEIARMLAGGNVTETALKHARELLAG
ncbi:MAG: DNA repair protein RecN [Deltaproteobacteria bacterium]|nr:DNA repair protein RecN [Deltaproteobacteria bacterium]